MRYAGTEAVFSLSAPRSRRAKTGRWGNKQWKDSVRPETVRDYWICLNTFFKWLAAEGVVQASPMAPIQTGDSFGVKSSH